MSTLESKLVQVATGAGPPQASLKKLRERRGFIEPAKGSLDVEVVCMGQQERWRATSSSITADTVFEQVSKQPVATWSST